MPNVERGTEWGRAMACSVGKNIKQGAGGPQGIHLYGYGAVQRHCVRLRRV
jgi:hypothetical protein